MTARFRRIAICPQCFRVRWFGTSEHLLSRARTLYLTKQLFLTSSRPRGPLTIVGGAKGLL